MDKNDRRYVCSEIRPIIEAFDNAYCSSSNDPKISEACENIIYNEHTCNASREGESIVRIHIGSENSNNETENQIKPGSSTQEIMQYKFNNPSIIEADDHNYPPSMTIKCINTISNKWHCGIGSTKYKHTILSKENTEKRANLLSELFDKTSGCVSKL
jgi:hypothetical protein